jgi:hypothetical protein
MKSEGPYKIGKPEEYEGTSDYISLRLVGPGLGRWGAPDVSDLMPDEGHLALLVGAANTIYAEGRKSMEKDFRELLSISEMMNAEIDYGSEGTDAFGAWKKARGIS